MGRFPALLLAVGLGLVTGPGTSQDTIVVDNAVPAYQPSYDVTPCPFPIPPFATVDCGYLTVPEQRDQTDGPRIKLAVAILRAPASPVKDDPMVYLTGGPGSSALDEFRLDAQAFVYYPFRSERDLIFIDQRGTGYSIPNLDCPELRPFNDNSLPNAEEELHALRDCRARLINTQVNLRAYNSRENAADIEDLRRALGYQQWNLFGVSYGSRLALTVLRDHPGGVRSVVLDSPYPPNADIPWQDTLGLLESLKRLVNGCYDNNRCREAYPKLETVLTRLIGDFTNSPRSLSVLDYDTEQHVNVQIHGTDLVQVLIQAMQNSYLLPLLPRLIAEAANGDYRLLGQVLAEQGYGIPGPLALELDRSDSEGMYHSVICQEEYAFGSLAQLGAGILTQAPPALQTVLLDSGVRQFGICESWNVGKAPDQENQAVASDVPALLLVGAYDAYTPQSFAQLAADTLSHAYTFVFPTSGHSVLTAEDCALELVNRFIDNPAWDSQSTCFAELNTPGFFLPGDDLTF